MDVAEFQSRMDALHDAMVETGDGHQQGLAVGLVQDEARRLVRQIVRFIPPQSQKQGETAVTRDLSGLISEGPQTLLDRIRHDHGSSQIDTYFNRKSDGQRVHIVWDNLITTTNRKMLERMHNSYKDARGRVPENKLRKGQRGTTWSSRVVVPFGVGSRYIADTVKRVGRMKASWCRLAEYLGLKVESWVSRHLPSPFAVGDSSGMSDGQFPVIVFGSRQRGIVTFEHQISQAVRVRSEAMRRRTLLVISGFNKTLSRDMKRRARELRQKYDEEAPWNDYGTSGISN